jgi:hypothetical protein
VTIDPDQAGCCNRAGSIYVHTCPGGARPPIQVMIAFIDDHRGAYGVEPIGNIPPAEAEERYHAMTEQPAMAA